MRIEDIGDMVDHISNLPDCILHQILSFMPTVEVVKTSILSTRWKKLWASVPNVDFDDAKEVDNWRQPGAASFKNFVERVLASRVASNLEKFRLTHRGSYYASQIPSFQIHSWISHAIMHNVHELDLTLFGVDPSVIPRSMFHSPSLVSLKIRMDCVIQLPSHVSFPCLKTLHLSYVGFMNDDDPEQLFSRCPVLEELVLSDCKWVNFQNVVISSSTLKSLTIADRSRFKPWYDSSFKIKIDAVNLPFFQYFGDLSIGILLNNTSSLVKSFLHIYPSHGRQKEVACRAVDLLEQLQSVVSLGVSNRTMESVMCRGNMPLHFPNLRHLALTEAIEYYSYGALMDLLYFCPVLESIYITEGFGTYMPLGENNSIWSSIPICISNCLKRVTFNNFHVNDSEICFIKCVLKYALVLERMDIRWSKTRVPDLKKQTVVRVKKELETMKRSSTACVIKFS